MSNMRIGQVLANMADEIKAGSDKLAEQAGIPLVKTDRIDPSHLPHGHPDRVTHDARQALEFAQNAWLRIIGMEALVNEAIRVLGGITIPQTNDNDRIAVCQVLCCLEGMKAIIDGADKEAGAARTSEPPPA